MSKRQTHMYMFLWTNRLITLSEFIMLKRGVNCIIWFEKQDTGYNVLNIKYNVIRISTSYMYYKFIVKCYYNKSFVSKKWLKIIALELYNKCIVLDVYNKCTVQ
jgi:hypothetical protein